MPRRPFPKTVFTTHVNNICAVKCLRKYFLLLSYFYIIDKIRHNVDLDKTHYNVNRHLLQVYFTKLIFWEALV